MKQVVLFTVNQCGALLFEGTFTPPTEKEHEETMGDFKAVHLLTVTGEFTLPEFVTQVCGDFVETRRFSYGESPRTPPLVGTSLHR